MEETTFKKGNPPAWWVKVITDLERAVMASKKSFNNEKIVIKSDLDDQGNIEGYYIRLKNGVGYYPADMFPTDIPVGSKIKSTLPKPKKWVPEPEIISYTYQTIRDNIKLIPRLWLYRIVRKMHTGSPITPKDDFRNFKSWILLEKKRKQDIKWLNTISQRISHEGLRGLARYNKMVS